MPSTFSNLIRDIYSKKWQSRTPAVAAHLIDHIWTVKELLTTLPLPRTINTRKGNYQIFLILKYPMVSKSSQRIQRSHRHSL